VTILWRYKLVCLVDGVNLFFITWSAFKRMMQDKNHDPNYVIKKEDLGLFYHMLFKKTKDYLTTYKDLVFAFEGLHSTAWRKQKYLPYKENRAAAKEDPNYAMVSPLIGDYKELLKCFHCKVMEVENCEGDDVIYKLSEYFTSKGEQVNIVSSDRDLTQICGFFDGVTVYNPMSQINSKCIAMTNAENYNKNIIVEKAIVGDASDNIKGLPRVGEKTFEKMLTDKAEWAKIMGKGDNATLYETILDIVDLRRYPKEYQDKIIEEFESFDYYNFNPQKVEAFFFNHALRKCLDEWSSTAGEISMMLNGKEEASAEEEIIELLNS